MRDLFIHCMSDFFCDHFTGLPFQVFLFLQIILHFLFYGYPGIPMVTAKAQQHLAYAL